MSLNIIPPFLKRGDAVGILSTARKITEKELEFAINEIMSWGLQVKLGDTIGLEYNQFAGSDEQRIQDFNSFIEDDSIKAILCARGGYGTVRIVDSLNLERLRSKPKWICGYSDVTVLHNALNNIGISSIHSTMPINFETNSTKARSTLKDCLFGKRSHIQIQGHEMNRPGFAKGELVGGNLSVLYSQLGSPTDLDLKGKILFLEDLDEYIYHIDRMIINLKRVGWFDQIVGLIIGGLTDMNDNDIPFGKSALEIVLEHTKEYSFPICTNFPAGHITDNQSIYLSMETELNVKEKKSTVQFTF